MINALRNRNFALLWTGQFISAIGDWAIFVSLPFYVYRMTNSILATGTMFFVETLPRLFVGSVAGVLADRWNRKYVMIVADFFRAAMVLLLLTIRSANQIWLVYAIGFTESLIAEFFIPTRNAIIPNIVDKDNLGDANSADAVSDAITRLVGPPLGGALMTLLGLTGVIFLDSASFLLSGVMTLLIPYHFTFSETLPKDWKESRPLSVWKDWLEGLKLIRLERFVSIIFIITIIMMLGQGIINVLFIVFINDVLKSDALGFGWFITSQGIGGLVGSIVVGKAMRLVKPIILISASTSIAGFLFLLIVGFSNMFIAILLNFFTGIFAVFFMVSVKTLLQKEVSDQHLGRIFGTYSTSKAIASIIGMGLASFAGNTLGIVTSLIIAGILLFIAGMPALLVRETSFGHI